MQIDKQEIVDLLNSRGENDKAQEADAALPDDVDTGQHQGVLGSLGLSPTDLANLAGNFSL